MKRWNGNQEVEMPRVDAFIEEIIGVYRKHGMSIGHEDGQGAFEIEAYRERNVDWLRDARVRGAVDNGGAARARRA